jgi:hypothetical protein
MTQKEHEILHGLDKKQQKLSKEDILEIPGSCSEEKLTQTVRENKKQNIEESKRKLGGERLIMKNNRWKDTCSIILPVVMLTVMALIIFPMSLGFLIVGIFGKNSIFFIIVGIILLLVGIFIWKKFT